MRQRSPFPDQIRRPSSVAPGSDEGCSGGHGCRASSVSAPGGLKCEKFNLKENYEIVRVPMERFFRNVSSLGKATPEAILNLSSKIRIFATDLCSTPDVGLVVMPTTLRIEVGRW